MRMKVEGEHGKRRETFHFKKGNQFAFRCVKVVEECELEPTHTHTHTHAHIHKLENFSGIQTTAPGSH